MKKAFIFILVTILLICGCVPMPIGDNATSIQTNATDATSVSAGESTPSVHLGPEGTYPTATPALDIIFNINEPTGDANEHIVNSIDGLLRSIGSNRRIYLEPGDYDLTSASDYGKQDASPYMEWRAVNDGYELVIRDVENLQIAGYSADRVQLTTQPRYADVITYVNCENVSVTGMTLGHSQAPGECSGGVLQLTQSKEIAVQDCGLFGCGIFGVYAENCQDIAVTNTEIHDCSEGAGRFYECKNVTFTDCNIHDCGKPLFAGSGMGEVLVDGEPVGQ